MRIYQMPPILFKLFPQIQWKDSSAINQIFLTFDDGPDQNYTPKILSVLKEENALATFFVSGVKAKRNAKLIKQIYQEKHEIGIHSFIHERLFFQSKTYIYDQLNQSKKIIEEITGRSVRFFRPPFGVFSPRLIKVCSELNLKLVMWSLMTYDFDERLSDQSILKLISSQAKHGEIIVFHDGHVNSTRTAKILQAAIRMMKEKGLKLIFLSK